MSESLPNPFEAARRRREVITIELNIDDLIRAEPELSQAEAEDLLQRHGAIIASAMIEIGVQVALNLNGGTTP